MVAQRAHVLTVRLDVELARRLDIVARAQGLSIAMTVREAVAAYIIDATKSPVARRLLAEDAARIRQLLDETSATDA